MKSLHILLAVVFYVSTIHGIALIQELPVGMQLTTNYGTITFDEPVLIELIKSPAFERLKKIHQYGVTVYVRQESDYNRYEHSLGVFCITHLFGAPLEEQVAALLHDVSHTVFSHVGDHLFNSGYQYKKSSYQDDMHEWFLEQSGIAALLNNHKMLSACSCAAKHKQPCFDQELPNLCADRIEYNLHGGLIDGLLTVEEVSAIIQALRFEDGQWYFVDQQLAKKFALVSLQLSEQRWGGPWNGFLDSCASQALKRALALNLVTKEEIHFSIDDDVWQKLLASTDADIQRYLARMHHYQHAYRISSPEESDMHIRGKFSGTDPFIKTDNGLVRLSALDNKYRAEYERVKDVVGNGFYITLNDVIS